MAAPGGITGSQELYGSNMPIELIYKVIEEARLAGDMELGLEDQLPNLFLALAPFKVFSSNLHKAFKARNFILGDTNAVQFHNLSLSPRGLVEHLSISLSNVFKNNTLPLRGSLPFASNNLTSITINLTAENPTRILRSHKEYLYENAVGCHVHFIVFLTSASIPGVKKLIVVLNNGHWSYERAGEVTQIMVYKGPKLPQVDSKVVGNLRLLTWENGDGGRLRFR